MACQTCQIPNVKASLINVIMILVIGVYYLPIQHINNSTIIQIIILPLYCHLNKRLFEFSSLRYA